MFDAVHSKAQTFRVVVDLDSEHTLGEFLNLLSEHGSPRIVCYDAAPDAGGSPMMILEFTSYEDALRFAQLWFAEDEAPSRNYVETITW